MPRGWREAHKPETADSYRGRRKIPLWRKKEFDKESNLPSVSPSESAVEQKGINETMNSGVLAASFAPLILNEGLETSNKSSNMTEALEHGGSFDVRYMLTGNLQPETKTTSIHGVDGLSNNTSLIPDDSSNVCSKVPNSNISKPLSLLPFLGMSSAVSMKGSITSPTHTSVPQWMQLLCKQDTEKMTHAMTLDASTSMMELKEEIKRLRLEQYDWEKERSDLLTQQRYFEEDVKQLQQAKEEKEQQVVNLQRELRAKEEHANELEMTLSTAQQALEEYRQKESCDWVICRDEIQLTDKCLGIGGWGTVIMGRFRGCKVAVKQIHELILSPHNRRLFEREMNIASRCRHPCLLQFIGATNDEGSPLFVTELMETSLRALLEERYLSETEVAVISLDVAQALNYLHKSKPPIIHRDISSANVLLWQQGNQWRGKVSDYGTANFMQQTMTVAPGAMIYSAPEALTANQTIKIDVYSFGVLLCEMCLRELPDPKQREEQVTLVSSHMFRSLIWRCLQSDPLERPDMEDIIGHFDSHIK